MTFKTIHTTHGLQAMAAAEAAGVPIHLTQMAVGDGNGNAVAPIESQTMLARELYRASVNRVFQDPVTPTKFTAELIVPATAGGFTLREVGIFDADGGLFAVGNLPPTYKPNIAEGSYSDTVIRMEFLVSNASVITLSIDPNVVVATRAWVLNNISAASMIPGGTTNQVLRKHSNADGDTEWANPVDVNVLVTTVEEQQTLAAAQTTVNLATTTTTGLAVYVEGVRLPKAAGTDGWQPDGAIITRLALGQAYPAGTKIICVQNEPASNLDDPLAKAQNLADVPNKATARTNLDVYSKAEADQKAPVSEVAYFARTTAPTGWLKANGAAISRTAYGNLFSVIGTTFGVGDGFNTFNIPDLRGEFLRSLDDSRGIDPGRTMGSAQASQNLGHTHDASATTGGGHQHSFVDTDTDPPPSPSLGGLMGGQDWWDRERTKLTDTAGAHSHDIDITGSGGNESRPRNIALLACVKY